MDNNCPHSSSWLLLPKSIFKKPHLSRVPLLIYSLVVTYSYGGGIGIYITNNELSDIITVDPRTIKRALKILSEEKLIRVTYINGRRVLQAI